jgi:hypothetical protein
MAFLVSLPGSLVARARRNAPADAAHSGVEGNAGRMPQRRRSGANAGLDDCKLEIGSSNWGTAYPMFLTNSGVQYANFL